MAMKDQSEPEAKHKAAPQVDAAESELVRRLRAEIAARDERIAAAEAARDEAEATALERDERMAQLAAAMPMQALPEDEQPVFELTAPYFSQDCVYYPEGAVLKDPFGTMPLNEFMYPLNEPAQIRYDAYMNSLPGGGTPSLDLIMEAAMELRPRSDDDPHATARYHAAVLERAMLKKFAQEGRIAGDPGEKMAPQKPRRPHRPDPNVPPTGGVRWRMNTGADFSPTSRVDHGPLPAREMRTQQVR
jgi:hypothetical protein